MKQFIVKDYTKTTLQQAVWSAGFKYTVTDRDMSMQVLALRYGTNGKVVSYRVSNSVKLNAGFQLTLGE